MDNYFAPIFPFTESFSFPDCLMSDCLGLTLDNHSLISEGIIFSTPPWSSVPR